MVDRRSEEALPTDCAISVVVPAHNEAGSLPPLVGELQTVLGASFPAGTYEIVVVDDGSDDGTLARLQAWFGDDPHVRAVRFDTNRGQSAALAAGVATARGAVLVTLDADGQNPPADVPRLLAALEGCDFVCGWRVARCDGWGKRGASWVANGVRRWFLRDGLRDTGCAFRAFRREVWDRLPQFEGMHRFLPALARCAGFHVVEVPVGHRRRTAGRSHYGILDRVVQPLCDLLAVWWLYRRRGRASVLPKVVSGLRPVCAAGSVPCQATFSRTLTRPTAARGPRPEEWASADASI